MVDTSSTPKDGENTWLWLIKIISGLTLIIILFIHLYVNHLLAPEGLLDFNGVIAYFQNPIVPIMEGTFLVFVVVHSLLGLRAIILDLNPSRKAMVVWNSLLTVFGLSAIVYGIWLLTSIVAQG
ncbi:MAG TPA: hypothetical protein G4N95_07355 [Anaerolineae bacterium]|nr:hypothetical protein [Anaerolineae bacterium]